MSVYLAIVGSRNFTSYNIFIDNVKATLKEWGVKKCDIAEIISGGARGTDLMAVRFADRNKIPLTEFLPDWDQFGRRAGPIRNKEIIGSATHVIAFPSRKGRGTQSSIKFAEQRGLPLKVVYID